ncbi:unnamed protein product [Lepeophtheirus salmonis]|uniref:(salmon louse) hypothetical protein n=1 Tax=Lepeophtheirus salmonis TaxID=72036 RepID=A0A7R8D6Y7_LEPSM|nr:unnamed protein product [Lepeophtheirus salmonis]CAF2994784.1 unnamed protein product [Lepeophtheirus salmonis]
MIDMTVVNLWLMYRRDADNLNLPTKDTMSLTTFKLLLAFDLMKAGKVTKKRSRPSSLDSPHASKKRCSCLSDLLHKDGIEHLPMVESKRNRCQEGNCVKSVSSLKGGSKTVSYENIQKSCTEHPSAISNSNVLIIEEFNNSTRSSGVLTLEKGSLNKAPEESMTKIKSRNNLLSSSMIPLEEGSTSGVDEGDTESVKSSIVSLGGVKSNTSLSEESSVEHLENSPLLNIPNNKVSDECMSKKIPILPRK